MKRIFFLIAILTSLISSPVFAQDAAATAAAIAEKQEAEEKMKRLTGDVESLIAANSTLQKKVSALAEELNRVREEQVKAANNNSVQEDLKRLAEKIQEVDKKRDADKELIVAQIKKIGENFSAPTPSHSPPKGRKLRSGDDTTAAPDRPSSPDKSSIPEKGFEYTVEKGDYLSKIVAAYNAEFKSKGMKQITSQQVLDANPGLKPEKIYPGKKIFIPMPAP